MTTERMTLPVADLIDGDVLIPQGWAVHGYPHGVTGTMLPCDRSTNSEPFVVTDYYRNSETPVDILREV